MSVQGLQLFVLNLNPPKPFCPLGVLLGPIIPYFSEPQEFSDGIARKISYNLNTTPQKPTYPSPSRLSLIESRLDSAQRGSAA